MFFTGRRVDDALQSPLAELPRDLAISLRRPALRSPASTRCDHDVAADAALAQPRVAPSLRFRIARQSELGAKVVAAREVLHQVHALLHHVRATHLEFSLIEEFG